MTFFNVRLGAWLPNPKWCSQKKTGDAARRFLQRPGPLFALGPLIQEALGEANDTRRYIELTDGGHFEDLALYEMVMRRVKTIILVDAGADPDYEFEDLGNAIRKIQIDLGVPIEFKGAIPMTKGGGSKNFYCAVGTIKYGCVDCMNAGGEADARLHGTLVYIKPVLTGQEPTDIFQYAATHPSFPHQSTVDQFYNESQFESYRHLGSWVIDQITDPVRGISREADGTLANFVEFARAFSGMR